MWCLKQILICQFFLVCSSFLLIQMPWEGCVSCLWPSSVGLVSEMSSATVKLWSGPDFATDSLADERHIIGPNIFYCVQWCCKRTARSLIWMPTWISWPGHSLSIYTLRYICTWRHPITTVDLKRTNGHCSEENLSQGRSIHRYVPYKTCRRCPGRAIITEHSLHVTPKGRANKPRQTVH